MKLYFSLPDMSDLFNHDSPLIKILAIGVPAFILLSSVTVFAGFALHFALVGWQMIVYGIAIYPLFCLAPDLINLACFTWIVRTLLKFNQLEANQATTGILIAFCLAISAGCTWYSFNLSQVSAEQVSDWMKPKETLRAQLDSTLINQAGNLLDLDSTNTAGRYQALDIEQAATVRIYDNQIKALVDDSLQLEKDRRPSNTFWVTKQLKPIKAELTRLRYQRDTTLQRIATEYKAGATVSAGIKDTLTSLLLTDAKAALQRKERDLVEYDNRHRLITRLVSAIAGYAVFILLALGAVREILNHRNGIEPLPVVGPFDFQNFEHIKEVIALPFVTAGRYLINFVRRKYKALPDLEDPALDPFAYDYKVPVQIRKIGKDRAGIAATADKKPLLEYLREKKADAGADNPPVSNGPVKPAKTTGKDNTIRQCLNCGQDYRIRSFNQKYCGQDCKEEYHAKQHDGKAFDPKAYHRKRRK